MEIKVIKKKTEKPEEAMPEKKSASGEEPKEVLTRVLDNGVVLERVDGQFFAVIDEERLPITKEDTILILQNHDHVFNVIIDAKRRYVFNTALDRYSPLED